jgi:glycine/D-amino acid oxidase-like deaminating enzyme
MTERQYEYLVVGKGLMGAAAARHLSAHSPSVALVGPDEPPDRPSHGGVFGSHYDEGRITRILDRDRIWALLAQRSIARYRDLERRSGISYYDEVGHLAVGPRPASSEDYIARLHAVARDLGVVYETYEEAAWRERFPYLAFEAGSVGRYQPHAAGHVSPRAQVRAQTAVAAQQGVHHGVHARQGGDQIDGHAVALAHQEPKRLDVPQAYRQDDHGQQQAFRHQPVERLLDRSRIRENQRALSEIVDEQRRQDQQEPCSLDRFAPEVAEIGV